MLITNNFIMKTLLCCIGRRENQHIREFVEWYKKLGFTNIVLYDNNYDGEEDFHDAIGDYIDDGYVILKDYTRENVNWKHIIVAIMNIRTITIGLLSLIVMNFLF